MKILVAPNSFKECADSTEISGIICKALKKTGKHEIERLPISDGGDGFLKVCSEAFMLKTHMHAVPGCFTGSKVKIAEGRDAKDNLYLEAADFIGLKTIPVSERNPLILSSRSMGEYIHRLKNNISGTRTSRIILGIGGTGTSDLGLGLCVPFGLRLLDKNGIELDAVPLNFPKVKKIVLPRRLKMKTEVVLDVKVPLFGRSGTSRVFSPQKGASPGDVKLLEKGVRNILLVLRQEHGLDFENELIGAGGGLTLGLMLISRTKVITSREFLIKKLGLRQKIRRAELVISGEGRIDYQSYMEKATGIVIEEALKQKKRVVIISGSSDLHARYKKGIEIISLMDFYKSKSESVKNYKTGIEKAIFNCFL